MSPVTTQQTESGAAASTDPGGFRQRLLDGLASAIEANGYRTTTVADIVRAARTSRRTFYEHFDSKEACFVALLTDANRDMIREISAAVDQRARWTTQVRQAIMAWIACTESRPAITLSWIRDVPSLGTAARELQRDVMAALVTMIQTLCDTEEWRSVRTEPVSDQLALMLLGGLRELSATTVENGHRVGDMTEVAVRAAIALLGPPPPGY